MRIINGHKTNAFDHGVGAGKTALAVMLDQMGRSEFGITRTCYYSARKSLVRGAAKAFNKWVPERAHRISDTDGNTPPLILPGFGGYASTLASLVSNPALHARQFRDQRVHLIIDEAQFAGEFTNAADYLREMVEAAELVTVMTATFDRHDRSRLVGVEMDEDGLPVITHSYGLRESIVDHHCRYPDIRMMNMGMTWSDGATETVEEIESHLSRALKSRGVWEPMADLFLDEFTRRRQFDPSEKALVLAVDQDHARILERYMAGNFRGGVVLSISEDDNLSDRVLDEFATDRNAILVAVDKCGIGYDAPAIGSELNLSAKRFPGRKLQEIGRALRVNPNSGVPVAKQKALIVAPNDPRMREFLEWLRGEGRQAAIELNVCDECMERPCACPCQTCLQRPCICERDRDDQDPIYVTDTYDVGYVATDIDGDSLPGGEADNLLVLAEQSGIYGTPTELRRFVDRASAPGATTTLTEERPYTSPRDEKAERHKDLQRECFRWIRERYPLVTGQQRSKAAAAMQKKACGGQKPTTVSTEVVERAIERVEQRDGAVRDAMDWGVNAGR